MGKVDRKKLLSNEFKVGVAIYYVTAVLREDAWFGKLKDILADYMSTSTLLRMLRFLESWRIIKAEYGPTDTGRAAKLYTLSNEDFETMKKLYETYWNT